MNRCLLTSLRLLRNSQSNSSSNGTFLLRKSRCRRNSSRRWKSSNHQSYDSKLRGFTIGITAGTCGSLAGMGGGFVMIPLLTTSTMGLTQHQATATSLFAVATTGLAGALSYGMTSSSDSSEQKNGDDKRHSENRSSTTKSSSYVDTEVATFVALSGMATAGLGARFSSRLSQTMLRRMLGFLMLMVAPTIPLKKHLLHKNQDNNEIPKDDDRNSNDASSWQRRFQATAIGGCSGFLAGLFGVGGGAVVVPALSLGLDMNHYQALGTSLCAMVPTAIVGTATHVASGTVVLCIAPSLALGAFGGGWMGGQLGQSLPEQQLMDGFGWTMVVLGLRALFKA